MDFLNIYFFKNYILQYLGNGPLELSKNRGDELGESYQPNGTSCMLTVFLGRKKNIGKCGKKFAS